MTSALRDRAPPLKNLTGIRGVAALWVVLFHFQATILVHATLRLGPLIGGGACGVDVFFVLSGLILSITYGPRLAAQRLTLQAYGDFLRKRLARIYPTHLFTFLIMLASWGAAAKSGITVHGEASNDAWSALCNLLLIHAWGATKTLSWNGPSWSVSAEWFAYVALFPFSVMVLRRLSAFQSMIVAMMLWSAFMGFLIATHRSLEVVTTTGIARIAPEFVAGYAIWRCLGTLPRAPGDLYVLLGAVGIALSLLLPSLKFAPLLPAIVALMLGLHRGGVWVDRLFGNRLVVFFGKISYSIYMMHLFVLIIANQLLRHAVVAPTALNGRFVLLAEVLAAVIAGYLCYRLVEAPARRLLVDGWDRRRSETPEMPSTSVSTVV
jgi:peptidoglycan/LPS O-acetylase OafA/YrhL